MSNQAMKFVVGVEPEQQNTYHFLLNPISYGEAAGAVKIINTHCAHLFLCGETVYKIKRAVAYSYLDMSTLEKRRKLCQREIDINQPVLPEVYLGTVAITLESNGSLTFNGRGEPVEWAIRMQRFDEADVLDNVAKAGQLTADLAKRMGHSIAEYHDSLECEDVHDGFDRIREVVDELINELELVKTFFDNNKIDTFRDRGRAELDAQRNLLNQRANDGFVKRCHGDLHLRNLVLRDGKPVPFDALEFDERMATTDVLYDLAFLLMDLDHRGLIDHKNRLLNEYLLHSPKDNYRALALMPLFLFCRAGIKAMTSAQAASHDVNESKAVDIEAKRYLDLSLSYLEERPPRLIAIGGLSGTGKSTAASCISERIVSGPGLVFLRSDTERKAALSIPETTPLPPTEYTAEASLRNYKMLFEKARDTLEAGFSVVVDAVFLSEDMRDEIADIAISRSISFYGFWLEAPLQILEERIMNRKGDASDATVEVMRKQNMRMIDNVNWIKIDAADSVNHTVDQILLELPGDARNTTTRSTCNVNS